MFFLSSLIVGSLLSSPALQAQIVPATQAWIPAQGDIFVVDTKENNGYLVHEDGSFYLFTVATGQRRVVHYIGRTYNATTPERQWVAKSLEKKGDRITFGPTGAFLRLYKDGEDRTPYGIHGHAYSTKMLSDEVRYKSMGCIIVSEEMLSVIEKTFEINNGELRVFTMYGLEKLVASVN